MKVQAFFRGGALLGAACSVGLTSCGGPSEPAPSPTAPAASSEPAAPAAPLAQTRGAPLEAAVVDKVLANTVINQFQDKSGSGYLDIHPIFPTQLSEDETSKFIESLAVSFSKILPFLTDRDVDTATLQVIRITNRNEYNVGRGFTRVGVATLKKSGSDWQVERFERAGTQ